MEPLDNNDLTNEEFVRQLLKQNPNAAVVNPALFEPNRKQSKKLNKSKTKKGAVSKGSPEKRVK